MAITRGAKKAHRSSLRKQEFNLIRKNNAKKGVKSLTKLIASGDKKGAQEQMRLAQKALDKAVKKGTIKANTASRKKSRLSKLIKKL